MLAMPTHTRVTLAGLLTAAALALAPAPAHAEPAKPADPRAGLTEDDLRARVNYDALPQSVRAEVDRKIRAYLDERLGPEEAAAMQDFLRRRLPPGMDYPADRVAEIAEQKRLEAQAAGRWALRGDDEPDPLFQGWEPLGPGNVGGRTRALVISPDGPGSTDPDDPGYMLAGGVGGGVFKSEDGGITWRSSWSIINDPDDPNERQHPQAIAALAIDPNNPNTVWAATGEAFNSRDGDQVPWQDGVIGLRGLGLYRSTNAGETWTLVTATAFPNVGQGDFRFAFDLAISPRDSERIYAGTETGVWVGTINEVTEEYEFQRVLGNCLATDIAVEPVPPMASNAGTVETERVFAACGSLDPQGFWISTMGGEIGSWFRIDSNRIPEPDLLNRIDSDLQGRLVIDFLPGQTQRSDTWVYVLMARSAFASPIQPVSALELPSFSVVNIFRAQLGDIEEIDDDDDDVLDDVNLEFLPVLDRRSPTNNVNRLLLSDPLFSGICSGVVYPTFNIANFAATLRVAPDSPVNDPDNHVLWVGGVDLFRSDDGGRNFGVASYWYRDQPASPTAQSVWVHDNQHAIAFPPDYDSALNPTMYVANDGGVFRTDDATAAVSFEACPFLPGGNNTAMRWDPINAGYQVTQFHHGDTGNEDWPPPSLNNGSANPNPGRDVFVGGTASNGAVRAYRRGCIDRWQSITTGTGGQVAIDPTNNNRVYLSTNGFGSIFRTDINPANGAESIANISADLGPDIGVFIPPITLDPSDPSRMWTAGRSVWRSLNVNAADPNAVTWELVGTNAFTGNPEDFPGAREASAIAVAPSDPNVVYVGFENGYVWRTLNALEPNPEDVVWEDVSAGLPNFAGDNFGVAYISSIAIDPEDPEIVWVTNSRFVNETNTIAHVFRRGEYEAPPGSGNLVTFFQGFDGFDCDTSDDIDPTLPDVPANWILLRRCANSDCSTIGGECLIFVGTDIGVFVSDDAWAIDEECDPDGTGNNLRDSVTWSFVNTPDVPNDPLGTLPEVVVSSLDLRDENTIAAFTYGRGAWLGTIAGIRDCDDQTEAPCNPADLVAPFGTLDLADLSTFLQDWQRGRPSADLACSGMAGTFPCTDGDCGDGLYDLLDLAVFSAAFSAGCP